MLGWNWFSKQEYPEPKDTLDDIGVEAPIRSAGEDLLRRTSYADRITRILCATQVSEGRVFAIRAKWGDGKSSLKNLIAEQLEQRKGPAKYLDFNPWQWGDGDALTAALFTQMAAKLGGQDSPGAHERARLLRKYGAILAGAASPIKGAADQATGLPAWLPPVLLFLAGLGVQIPNLPSTSLVAAALVLASLVFAAGNILKMLGRDHSSDALDKVRERLEKQLSRLKGPLIVFVDDIDRLEPEQIRLLIRQVKVNANLPNVVFVLLFQPSIVINAFNEVAPGAGFDYLEKIVQANFDLPTVPADKIFNIFIEQLQPLIGELATAENGFVQVRWGNLILGGIRPLVRNLRDARRLQSSIAIHLPLHLGEIAFEVNLIDFVGLETLRVFEPDIHADIAANRTRWLQQSAFDSSTNKSTDKKAIETLIEGLAPDRQEAVKALLTELFPTVSWVFGGSHYGHDWIKEWIISKRVCTSQMFDRYFELQIPEGAVSDSLLKAFFESAGSAESLKTAIDDLERRQLLPALANRLDESVEQIPLSKISTLLPGLFDIGQRLKLTNADPFNSPYIATWRAASWYVRRLETPVERSRAMLSAMANSSALAVPALLISLDLDAREKSEPKRELAFDDAGLEEMKTLWAQKVRRLAQDKAAFLAEEDVLSLLYRWRDFEGGFEGPRGWVDAVAARDEDLLELLSHFVSIGRSQTMGDYVSTPFERLDRQPVEDFFGVDNLANRLKSLDRSIVTADQLKLIEKFEREIAVWRKGHQGPVEIFDEDE